MSFWKRNKQAVSAADSGRVQKAKKTIKRSPPVAMEVKILSVEALDSGLSAIEVGELVGVGPSTIHKWRKDYADGGVQGLCRKASSIAIRKQCSVLEEKIVALRRANPEHGVRRIRDDLRRHEGLEVSAYAPTRKAVDLEATNRCGGPRPESRPPAAGAYRTYRSRGLPAGPDPASQPRRIHERRGSYRR